MNRSSFSAVILAMALVGAAMSLAPPASARDVASSTRVTFLGISSFFIEGVTDTLLVDGFFSRTGLLTLKRVAPNSARIEAVLKDLCISVLGTAETRAQNGPCPSGQRKKLSYVLPLHGHFDHALDSAYIAARTGAQLITDASGKLIHDATQRRFGTDNANFNWNITPVEVENLKPNLVKPISFDDQIITLFYVPHAKNITYHKFAQYTDPKFEFKSSIFKLGEGQPLAAHIGTPSGSMLIIASPEMPPKKMSDVELKADVVFLSLGGLGLRSRDAIAEYFAAAVLEGGARRVYPIHWDKGETALSPKPHALKPMFPRLHRKVLDIVSELSTACGVEFHQIPIAIPFDPFQDIPDRKPTPGSAACLQALAKSH